MNLTPWQMEKLKDMMGKNLRRPDFRHVTGFSFHTSWDRATGRPLSQCTKKMCIDTIVNALVGRSVVPPQLMEDWLTGRLPAWRRDLGITQDKENKSDGEGKSES